ncbi:hypothetical protein GDO86_003923 [Hymenochirus boettgeri]|uniref:TIR domain-containing protein n=1 Tax=Hymenochirus boettgeri TaxID=247094 RepID=A0A8T2K6X2_9PIPI|nr:hypothetical protein GDO86_003923 [Hymenochirus boettgeri]
MLIGFLILYLLNFPCSSLLRENWYPKSLPCDVLKKENKSVLVDCSDRHLTEIPQGIPTNVTNLTLTINHISRISTHSFAQLKDLVEIDFRCNCVPVKVGPKDNICTQRLIVEERSFALLQNLKSLYLDGNQLIEFPRGLPSNLLLLSLEINNIISISKSNLSELNNIEMLYLGQNCYHRNPCNVPFKIEKDALQDLKKLSVLSLKSNNLTFVPVGLPNSLKELYLYNNAIQSIQEHDLVNVSFLEVLDLSGNCPRCYNSPFPCIPCPNNAPLQIHYKAFASLKNLRILRLHSNSLRTIPKIWFKYTSNLQVLDLSENFLASEISTLPFLQLVPSLKSLDLSFNFNLQVYPTELNLSSTFSSLKSLEILRIRGYVFQKLKKDNLMPLVCLKNLTILDLATNFIKAVDFSVFQLFHSLQTIILSNNKISPSGGSDLTSCEESNLSSEQYFDRTFQEVHYFEYDENARKCKSKDKEHFTSQVILNHDCQSYGKTLDLSQNNIFFLKPTDFTNLHFIKCLNLSGNAISQTLNGTEFGPLKQLKYLDFSNNRLDLLYSTAFQELTELEVLDISNNEHYFLAEGVTHVFNFTENLKKLTSLIMNNNKISTSTNRHIVSDSLRKLEFKGNYLNILWKDGDTRYLHFFKNLNNLYNLDISYNSLTFLLPGVFEGLPTSLKVLHLSNNELKTFNWDKLYLLKNLHTLDLSNNYLTTVPEELSKCTTSVEILNLSKNKIKNLSKYFLRGAFFLKKLDLSDNKIQYIGYSSFPEDVLDNLTILFLEGNPFKCNCDAVWFVSWINRTTVNIPNLVTGVKCSGPGTHRGQSLVLLDMYTCQQENINVIMYSLSASFIICLIVICVSSHLFFGDVWYIYHLFKAKINSYNQLHKFCYDALIMYDTKDSDVSDWVFKELVNILEKQGDKMFNLCLEERDFVPGQPFLDNLTESIQISRKTVFVLTRGYVKGGHFKTAFYLAHQRLIDEKLDVIILIMLEKTLQRSKYLRLRKRLGRNSVLYWPKNPNSHRYFWHCLKTELSTDNKMEYDKKFKRLFIR